MPRTVENSDNATEEIEAQGVKGILFKIGKSGRDWSL